MTLKEHTTEISNILVIGSGGAGLRAAIEARLQGLAVTVLGKREKKDVHTVLAAGGINAAFANIDSEDSWEQHFADTFLEGYGIGDPRLIEILSKESPDLVTEIDCWGANLDKLKDGRFDQRFFGAHTYRRTCFAGDFTGRSILKALLLKSKHLNIPIYDSQYVTELLISNGICFGAISFNTINAEKTVHLSDSVIIATGGHTRIWGKSSSRRNENNGDGFYLALKAGCSLIDMEMVQFHPTGMILPEEIAGTLVTEAVRGEGGRLINGQGERFMQKYDSERMELSTRDRVAKANYLEIIEGRGTKNNGVFLDISHKEKEFILQKLPRIYRQFIDYQMLDISKSPMEVSPTAHYSMGGILVTPEEHWTGVQGLYAAGEVTGGLHGANRLGGNSLAEILVFGKKAGIAAANHSKKIKYQIRSNNSIKSAVENIDSSIKNGKEMSRYLQHELSNIMWEHCGVVRNEKSMNDGLNKINELKELSKEVDVRVDSEGCEDLITLFNVKASLISSEATLNSAIQRTESRGAHQRSDYPNMEGSQEVNYRTFLVNNNKLNVVQDTLKELKKEQQVIVEKTQPINSFEDKLIE